MLTAVVDKKEEPKILEYIRRPTAGMKIGDDRGQGFARVDARCGRLQLPQGVLPGSPPLLHPDRALPKAGPAQDENIDGVEEHQQGQGKADDRPGQQSPLPRAQDRPDADRQRGA